jgi:hypothetical protein
MTILQLESLESMIGLVGSVVGCFKLFLIYGVRNVAGLTKIKIEAIITFVPDPDDRHCLAPMTLYILFDLLSRFYNQFNPVGQHVMPSDLYVWISKSCKITVLAHAKMTAICANEARSNDWFHVTSNTFMIIVSRETISQ